MSKINNAQRKKGPEFQACEFNETLTPEALVKALMEGMGFDIPFKSNPMDELNKLLEVSDLYVYLKVWPKGFQSSIKKIEDRQQLDLDDLKTLNRRLIEANYPSETPEMPRGFIQFPNELFDAFLSISKFLSPAQITSWLCYFRKTIGFNEDDKWVAPIQTQNVTGIYSRHVIRAKDDLLLFEMIFRDGKRVGIQQDYTKWRIYKRGKVFLADPFRESSISQRDRISPDVLGLMNCFYDAYEDKFAGAYFAKNFKNDRKLFEDLIAEGLSASEVRKRIDRFFSSDHDFIQNGLYTTGSFKMSVNLLNSEE